RPTYAGLRAVSRPAPAPPTEAEPARGSGPATAAGPDTGTASACGPSWGGGAGAKPEGRPVRVIGSGCGAELGAGLNRLAAMSRLLGRGLSEKVGRAAALQQAAGLGWFAGLGRAGLAAGFAVLLAADGARVAAEGGSWLISVVAGVVVCGLALV